jgi:enoyl-CoA hydratase/carnithine racemase
VTLIAEAEKPVIAAVEGHAAGGGLALAAACDIVFAAEDARFSCAFARIGLMPDLGALWTLPMRMGLGRARYFMMSGRTMSAREALDAGLVEEVTPPGAALAQAQTLAAEMASAATRALGMIKSSLSRLPASLDAMLKTEADAQVALLISEDFAEGRDAFLAKRRPVFRGR